MQMLPPLTASEAVKVQREAAAILRKLTPEKAWDACCKLKLTRCCPIADEMVPMEPGVNFFILALEALGCQTFHSCEGHPVGFYVAFLAPGERLARKIVQTGYFNVDLGKPENTYSISLSDYNVTHIPNGRKMSLRGAASAWMKSLLAEVLR